MEIGCKWSGCIKYVDISTDLIEGVAVATLQMVLICSCYCFQQKLAPDVRKLIENYSDIAQVGAC